jgi:gamma-glutamyltranspeptidase / glutathione hydrolase
MRASSESGGNTLLQCSQVGLSSSIFLLVLFMMPLQIDGREEAPATANINLFKDPDNPQGDNLTFFPNRISNGAAVGVPGTPRSWSEALRRYGTWQLKDTLRPAIDLAKTGFKVDATFAKQIQQNQARFAAFTSTTALYLPNGKPPAIGSTFKKPNLAKTYQMMSSQGVQGFYQGKLGQAMIDTVQHPPTIAKPALEGDRVAIMLAKQTL